MNSGGWGTWFRFVCSMVVIFGTIVGLRGVIQENYQLATGAWFATGISSWLMILHYNWPLVARLTAVMFAFFAAYHAFGGDWQTAFFMVGAADIVIYWYWMKRVLGK